MEFGIKLKEKYVIISMKEIWRIFFKFKFFIALSFTTYQHYTTYNINNNIHIYRVMYMMMVESD